MTTEKQEKDSLITASEAMRWAKMVFGRKGTVRIDRGVRRVGIEDDNDRLRVKGFGDTWDEAVTMAGGRIAEVAGRI